MSKSSGTRNSSSRTVLVPDKGLFSRKDVLLQSNVLPEMVNITILIYVAVITLIKTFILHASIILLL